MPVQFLGDQTPLAPADPAIPPDCDSLPFWRSGLKYWFRDAGVGTTVRRYDDVDAAIRVLETAENPDGSADVPRRRLGELAREQFEYANRVTRAQLTAPIDAAGTPFHAVFGFTLAEADESLWRAQRVALGDLSGQWPLSPATG